MRPFDELHPTVLLLWPMSVMLISVFTVNPVIQFIALTGGLMLCALLGCLKTSDTVFYLTMFLLISVTNPLFTHEGSTPVLFINGTPMTLEAAVYGILLAAMLVGVMLWCKAFNAVLKNEKILYLFGGIMPKTALIISAVLRFVPLLLRRFKSVSAARSASGEMQNDDYISKVKSMCSIFTAVLAWSLESSVDTVTSMKARGYGTHERTCYHRFKFTYRDAIMSAMCVLSTATVVAGIASGSMDFECYPSITAAKASAFSALCYTAFAVLSFAPFLIESNVRLRWKYYRSKI